jgi:hypothetical protein
MLARVPGDHAGEIIGTTSNVIPSTVPAAKVEKLRRSYCSFKR